MKSIFEFRKLTLLSLILIFHISHQISVDSNFKSHFNMNESSHKLNYKMEKYSTQIHFGSQKNKNSSTEPEKKVEFFNESTGFSSIETNNVGSSQEEYDGDFTAKFLIKEDMDLPLGFFGIGLTTREYSITTKLAENQWPGMTDYKNDTKEWLLSNNYKIASELEWHSNPNAHFMENDTVTIFRNDGQVGFRVNDLPNAYAQDFPGKVRFVICLKKLGLIVENQSYVSKPTEFGSSLDEKGPDLETRLAIAQTKVGDKLDRSAYSKILASVYQDIKSDLKGNFQLMAGEQINNKEILVSENKKFVVKFGSNGGLLVTKGHNTGNEVIFYNNAKGGLATSDRQILGLKADGTLYTQSHGAESDVYYWTNKNRLTKSSLKKPMRAVIQDNGNFVVMDANKQIIWSTETDQVDSDNSIGEKLNMNHALLDGQCITSNNVKFKLCNKNSKLEVRGTDNKKRWYNWSAREATGVKMMIDQQGQFRIYDDKDHIYWKQDVKVEAEHDKTEIIVTSVGQIEVRKIDKENKNTLVWTSNPDDFDKIKK
jgi:hypothetical protein